MSEAVVSYSFAKKANEKDAEEVTPKPNDDYRATYEKLEKKAIHYCVQQKVKEWPEQLQDFFKHTDFQGDNDAELAVPAPEEAHESHEQLSVRLLKAENWDMNRSDFQSDEHFAAGLRYATIVPERLLQKDRQNEAKQWIITMSLLSLDRPFDAIEAGDVEEFIALTMGESPFLHGEKKAKNFRKDQKPKIQEYSNRLESCQHRLYDQKGLELPEQLAREMDAIKKEFRDFWKDKLPELEKLQAEDQEDHRIKMEEAAQKNQAQFENLVALAENTAKMAVEMIQLEEIAEEECQKAKGDETKAKLLVKNAKTKQEKETATKTLQSAERAKANAEVKSSKAAALAADAAKAKAQAAVNLSAWNKKEKQKEEAVARNEAKQARRKAAEAAKAAKALQEPPKPLPKRLKIQRPFQQPYVLCNKEGRKEFDKLYKVKGELIDVPELVQQVQKNLTEGNQVKGNPPEKDQIIFIPDLEKPPKGTGPKSAGKKTPKEPKAVGRKTQKEPRPLPPAKKAKGSSKQKDPIPLPGDAKKSSKRKPIPNEAPVKKPRRSSKKGSLPVEPTPSLDDAPPHQPLQIPPTQGRLGSFGEKVSKILKEEPQIFRKEDVPSDPSSCKRAKDISNDNIAGCRKIQLITSRRNQLLMDKTMIHLAHSFNLCQRIYYDQRFHPIMSRMEPAHLCSFFQ
jgi:hypothetical protein